MCVSCIVSVFVEIKRSLSGVELTDSLSTSLLNDSVLLEEVPEETEPEIEGEGEGGEETKEAIVKTEVSFCYTTKWNVGVHFISILLTKKCSLFVF